jgi:hypothetical protein
LVQWQIAHAIGKTRTLWVCFQESIDDILRGLEGTRRVERKITAIVHTSGLICKLGGFGPAEKGTEALAELV